jgi:hypothetical protein
MKGYTRTYVQTGDIVPRMTRESLVDLQWRVNLLGGQCERVKGMEGRSR